MKSYPARQAPPHGLSLVWGELLSLSTGLLLRNLICAAILGQPYYITDIGIITYTPIWELKFKLLSSHPVYGFVEELLVTGCWGISHSFCLKALLEH